MTLFREISLRFTPLGLLLAFALAGPLLSGLGCGEDASKPTCGSDEACGVFAIVNEEREAAQLAPLDYHSALERSAQRHAEDMDANDYFDHTSLDGRSFVDRTNDAGYDGTPRGENIAFGQRNAEAVMQSWMQSPGHRNNILNPSFTEIGVGFQNGRWVQVFGSR